MTRVNFIAAGIYLGAYVLVLWGLMSFPPWSLLFTLVGIFWFWFMYCNNLTHRDRMNLLVAVSRSEMIDQMMTIYRAVSYQDHFLRRLTMRNPWLLYREKAIMLHPELIRSSV